MFAVPNKLVFFHLEEMFYITKLHLLFQQYFCILFPVGTSTWWTCHLKPNHHLLPNIFNVFVLSSISQFSYSCLHPVNVWMFNIINGTNAGSLLLPKKAWTINAPPTIVHYSSAFSQGMPLA